MTTLGELPPEDWRRLNTLLEQAMELDPAARDAWLAQLPMQEADLKPTLRRLFDEQRRSDTREPAPVPETECELFSQACGKPLGGASASRNSKLGLAPWRRVGFAATLPTFVFAAMFSWTSGAAQPPSGTVAAAIQTASGNYLTAVNGGGLGGPESGPSAVALHTDAIVAAKMETFTVVWLDSAYTKFALLTNGGNYVTAVNGGGVGGANDSSAPIHTDATTIAEWERMRLNFLPDARVTINVPNGRFLTAVNGGGMRGPGTSRIVTTDAVRHGAWETFTLVRLDTISADSLKPAPSPEPEWGAKLTRAEQAVITQHFGKHPPYHVGVSRSREFPEVLRVEQYIDDAGYRPLGIIVDGAWIEQGLYSIQWSPVEATRRVLMARGWTGLDDGRRKALALQWVEDSLPPGWSSQTSAEEGGHAPELSVEDGDVIVRVWLIRRATSVAGPRVSRDNSASVFRFKLDGSMTEVDPTHRTPLPIR